MGAIGFYNIYSAFMNYFGNDFAAGAYWIYQQA